MADSEKQNTIIPEEGHQDPLEGETRDSKPPTV